MNRTVVRQIGKRRSRETHGPGDQRVAQQAFLVHALEDRLARAVERQAGKFRVEVVRRRAQLVGIDRFADIDDFLNHVPAAGHDDDQHARRAQRHELDAVEHGGFVRRPDREPDAARRLRQHVRHLGQQ